MSRGAFEENVLSRLEAITAAQRQNMSKARNDNGLGYLVRESIESQRLLDDAANRLESAGGQERFVLLLRTQANALRESIKFVQTN
jgi:hypothetical protein